MKRILFLIGCLLGVFVGSANGAIPVAPYLPAQEKSTPKDAPITVQFPYENMTVARGAKKIFIFGQVNLPSPVTLDINGENIPVYSNGGFIGFVPVESGNFTFVLTASSKEAIYQAERHITVPGADVRTFTDKAEFDKEEIFPKYPVELMPGDTVDLYARGTPASNVTATLSGLKDGKKIPLKEDPSAPGVYRARYVIDPQQKPKTAKITYYLTGGPRRSETKITAPEKLKVLSAQQPLRRAQITSPGIKLRKIPTPTENLYPFYRAYGEVQINGRLNQQYRLVLNDQETAWLEQEKLQLLSEQPYTPNQLHNLSVIANEGKTRLLLKTDREVPISVHEFNDRLELTFYYTGDLEENFSLDTDSPLVEHITWANPAQDTVLLKIFFKKETLPWGHAYAFEDGQFTLDLFHKPTLTPTKNKPLTGARILLDAGHSPRRTPPYDGAVGPTGFMEYEGTLLLAEELKPLLEKQGATVLLTRRGNNRMTLPDRYQYALQENAHLFISLHYNALSEVANPRARARGFTVYYTYPHSFALAQSVYDSFTRLVPLPDNGMISNDILFIPRMSEFPSILVENAFLMLPEQEEMAKTKEGRQAFVQALYEGILNFYGVKLPATKTKKVTRKQFQKPAKQMYLKPAPTPVLKGS